MFTGGILRSPYNQIKSMLDDMANNNEEWRDDGFGSRQENQGTIRDRDRIEDGADR